MPVDVLFYLHFFIFLIPFVFCHLSVRAAGAWMSGGTETKEPLDVMEKQKISERKITKTQLKCDNLENPQMNSSPILFFFQSKKNKCARAFKKGCVQSEEHALQPQKQILGFHTFIEEKMRLLTHSLLFIDCP